MPQTLTITLPGPARWLVCAAICASAAFAALVSARAAAAETIIYLAAKMPVPPAALDLAHSLEPSNPETAFVLGTRAMDSAQPPDLAKARELLESAAAAAPNRPAIWLAIGRERELSGDVAGARTALERATSLAPTHWSGPWAIGNLDVRAGDLKDAGVWLRRAVFLNSELAPIAVQTMWMATDKDLPATLDAFDGPVVAQTALVGILLTEKRVDDAAALWRTLASRDSSDPAIRDQGRQLAAALLAAGRGSDYADIANTVDPGSIPKIGDLANASFDEPILDKETNPFRWLVTQSKEARVSVDNGRQGGKSLRVDYESTGGAALTSVAERVRLSPGSPYLLTFWASTNDLHTGGPPAIAVFDAANDAASVAAEAIPTGTYDWTEYRLAFTAPASGIASIRLARTPCAATCPVFGTVRIDDLVLAPGAAAQ